MKAAAGVAAGLALALAVVSWTTARPAAARPLPACRATFTSAPQTLVSLASTYASNPSVVATNATDAFLATRVSGHNVIEGISSSGKTLWVKQVSGTPGLLMANAATVAFAEFHGAQRFRMAFYNLTSGRLVQGPPLQASGNPLYSYGAFPAGFLVESDFAYSDPSHDAVYIDIYSNSGDLRRQLAVPTPGGTAPIAWSVSGGTLFVAVPPSTAPAAHGTGRLSILEVTAKTIRRYYVSASGASYLAAVSPVAVVLFSGSDTNQRNLAASGWALSGAAKRVWADSLPIGLPVIQGPGGLLYSAGGVFSLVSGGPVKVYPGLAVNGLTGHVVARLGAGNELVIPWLATERALLVFEQTYGSSRTAVVLLSPSGATLQTQAMSSQPSVAGLSPYRPLVLQGQQSMQILSPLLGRRALILSVAACGG